MCTVRQGQKCSKHPYMHAPKDGEIGEPMCEWCHKKITSFELAHDGYVVTTGDYLMCVKRADLMVEEGACPTMLKIDAAE